MAEADLLADLDEIRVEVGGEREPLGGLADERGVTLRVGGRELQQPAGVRGKPFDLSAEAGLEVEWVRHGEATVRGHPAGYFEQREGVAVRLGDDPLAHPGIDPPGS